MNQQSVVSIDVGIKNLSICHFTYNSSNTSSQNMTIHIWCNINLVNNEPERTIKCADCSMTARYTYDNVCYCTRHLNKHNIIRPENTLTARAISIMSRDELESICAKWNTDINSQSMSKTALSDALYTYMRQHTASHVAPKQATSKQIGFPEIGRKIASTFNTMFVSNTITTVLIENQIGPLANRMKTIQGMLTQYFVMKHEHASIHFVSASVKLKPFVFVKKPSTTATTSLPNPPVTETQNYKNRKKNGIVACAHVISCTNVHSNTYPDIVDYMHAHKKKDDLADCFLQGWATCIWNQSTKTNVGIE